MPAAHTVEAIAAPAGRTPPAPAYGVSARSAALVYVLLTAALTWPLPTALASSLPWDMGDPLLNCWILAWSADHLWRFATGDWAAFSGYWNANIFHPSPLALAYSEHLFAQAVQILPVWAVTRNPVLCYNLVFLSSFVLSGLGTFLFVRRLTGNALAALAAGVFYAVAPYRISQFSHVQVLSSQWMPFVLYGIRVYLDTGRGKALAGATAAWIAQNLSCGYYLIYFAPVLGLYIACELSARGRWRDIRTLAMLGGSAIVTGVATLPFVIPYLVLRRIEFPARSLEEVQAFSADTWAYLTTHPAQWLWGSHLDLFPKAEGETFLGFVPMSLALGAVVLAFTRAVRATPAQPDRPRWRRLVSVVLLAGIVLAAVTAIAILYGEGFAWRIGDIKLRAVSLSTALWRIALFSGLLLVASSRAREIAKRFARADTSWHAALLLVAVVLSFGPAIESAGRTLIREAPYHWLYTWVPGFDGLRVPARYAMLAALWLAVLAGSAVSALIQRTSRPVVATAILVALFIAEAGVAPIPLDPITDAGQLAPPRRHLFARGGVPAVYRAIDSLPADAIVAEFPFGSTTWDVRYVFYSAYHWRRIVNGYSGGFPHQFVATVGALTDLRLPDLGWQRLVDAGTTHVVLHKTAYRDREDLRVEAWLLEHGARRLAAFDSDVLFQLPPRLPGAPSGG